MSDNDLRKKLRDVAMNASSKAYSPYSNARIGCALSTKDGEIFGGCNVENSSYGATVCAERVAIFKAVANGNNEIDKLYVYSDEGWPPCGVCRQVISEFANNNTEIIIGDKEGKEKTLKFGDLFPYAFTPEHLANL